MGHHLAAIDAAVPASRWPMVRERILASDLAFYAELRSERPVLALPELTLVSRYADCTTVLRRHDAFGVDLYVPKQGSYWMAQDDTPTHWRDKSIMRAMLDYETVPAMRAYVGERTDAALDASDGAIEAVAAIGRAVPVALCQQFFGFEDADPADLIRWSYWNQQDAFHNQAFDPVTPEESANITREREAAGKSMVWFLGRKVIQREIAVKLGFGGNDPMTRLLRLMNSDACKLNLRGVAFNTGGLLIGAVETTNHTAISALAYLLADPARAAAARAAAHDPAAFDGHVFEALRFRPAFPYYFRVAHAAVQLAGDTGHAATVQPGTTVLGLTHAAMFDPAIFADPDRFDPARSALDGFTFGHGLHECLGRAIGAAMIPEIVRRILLRPGIAAEGPIEWKGGVPESFRLRWPVEGGGHYGEFA